MSRSPAPAQWRPDRTFSVRVFSALERFLHMEAMSGVVLLVAAAVALVWANSPFAASYHHLWETRLTIQFGGFAASQSLHFLINEALMTIFFLVVGMEIRREMHSGALAAASAAALPLAAAVGGVVVPAVLYLALNAEPIARAGWAVPTATDIAFAVGVLALLGKWIPPSLRIFLLALAIIDDVVAVIIIAVFYSSGLQFSGFLIAAAGIVLVFAFQRIGVVSAWAYVVPGAVLWWGLMVAGAHPTLAGVALGLMTPAVPFRSREIAPAITVQMALHPWVAFGIMPLFALANAGVTIDGSAFASPAGQSIMIGVAVALVLGKPIGIFLGSWIAVRLKWCVLPVGVTWGGVAVVGCLGGIGFTMSIFIAMLAFTDPNLLAAAKLGVLAASVAAATVGLMLGFGYALSRRSSATKS